MKDFKRRCKGTNITWRSFGKVNHQIHEDLI